MPATEIRRSIVSVQLLTRFAAGHGMTAKACLLNAGIDEAALVNPQTEILAAQELQVARNLVSSIGHIPGIGLDAGLQYHLSSYGIWGFALLTSPNLRSAVAIATRYLDLSYAFVRFQPLQAVGKSYRLHLDDRQIPDDVRQFLFERDLGAWANAMREMCPTYLPVTAAEFRFPRPSYAARLRKLCGVEPRFNATDNAICIDPSHLDAPLPQSDSDMARLCLAQCRQLLEKRRVRAGIAGRVRDRLLQSPGDMPGIDQVSRDLHIASRSLRRRLEEEGTSFRALLDEIRQMLAEELLMLPGMKLDEIAARLGYSESASFIHAFKRWKGVPPNVFRGQHHPDTE
ncbi:MAG TPA: AraC family transcriptional regulator [Stenotrophobium sp.]|jgi:AraC-like DNA-binding protein|nr:AraC family transcriptional regulator [Stenotrophobium sp.]